jgi:hypothetical protein
MDGSSAGLPRFLATLQPLLWPFYMVWSAGVLAVWTFGIGEVELLSAVTHPDLGAALRAILGVLDPVWIALGFYHVYTGLVREKGLAQARRWIGYGFLLCILIAWFSSRTSWPLGPVYFTERLGKKVGPVPLCLPLLWLSVVLGARATASRLLAARKPSAFQAALATPVLSACLACASALLLNPIAWKQRSWWLWYPADPNAPATAPLTALITLSVFSLGATAVMRRRNEPNESPRGMSSPLWIFVVMNATSAAALIVRTAI